MIFDQDTNFVYFSELLWKNTPGGKEIIEKGNMYLNETLPAIKNKFSDALNEEIEDAYQNCIENNKTNSSFS